MTVLGTQVAQDRRAPDGFSIARSQPSGAATGPNPRGEIASTPGDLQHGRARRPNGALAGLRILVVEDEADARELVSAILVDAGASVEMAGSAAEGFEAVRKFLPDLMVSDIGMPDEDGYSLMRRVRALDAAEGGTLPAAALSAFTRAEDRAKALGSGFDIHIGKPVIPNDLVYTLRRLAASLRK